MKYAVRYTSPNGRVRRTRFVSLRMAKIKEKTLKDFGFITDLIPRSEYTEKIYIRRTVDPRRHNLGTTWSFVPFATGLMHLKDGSPVKNKRFF